MNFCTWKNRKVEDGGSEENFRAARVQDTGLRAHVTAVTVFCTRREQIKKAKNERESWLVYR